MGRDQPAGSSRIGKRLARRHFSAGVRKPPVFKPGGRHFSAGVRKPPIFKPRGLSGLVRAVAHQRGRRMTFLAHFPGPFEYGSNLL